MKSYLTKIIYVAAFAIAGILFQISCSNSENTAAPNNVAATGKVIYSKWTNSSTQTIWTCDYDGSNQNQIPIVLPSNLAFTNSQSSDNAKLSPDGTKVFFNVVNIPSGEHSIYSCDIDGSNLQQIVGPESASMAVGNIN